MLSAAIAHRCARSDRAWRLAAAGAPRARPSREGSLAAVGRGPPPQRGARIPGARVGMIGRRRFLLSGGGAIAAAAAARRPWARAAAAAASPHVVIVGGGFAGGCCALELRRLSPSIAVTLIDANSSYVTCPMSDAVITELRTMSSVTSTRAGIERAGVRLVHDAVVHIEADKRRVRLRGGAVVAYDKLVVAPGIRFLFGEPEGYDEAATQVMPHAWQGGPRSEEHTSELQSQF